MNPATPVTTHRRGSARSSARHRANRLVVIVVNAEKVRVTGDKDRKKNYYRHSGYPGGIKETSLGRMRETHPERIIESAVKGMLPKNPLGRAMYRKLKVYPGADHPHAAQQPRALEFNNG